MALLLSLGRAPAACGGGVSTSAASVAAAVRARRGLSGAATADDGGSSDTQRAGDPLSDQIVAEHERLEGLFARYNEDADDNQRLRIGFHIIRELSVHAAKEEMLSTRIASARPLLCMLCAGNAPRRARAVGSTLWACTRASIRSPLTLLAHSHCLRPALQVLYPTVAQAWAAMLCSQHAAKLQARGLVGRALRACS